MNRRFGRLPPLTSLEGFEAAARLGSFSLAAEELNITQSAVSHQIRTLEDFFGQPLFRRVKRSVELTDAGKDFLKTATKTLEVLSQGQHRLGHYLKPGSVVLAATPMIARKWLLPRLGALQDHLPEIQPWLYTSDDPFDLESTEIDLAICYGDGHWDGLEATKLFHDYLTPLCAPALLGGDQRLDSPLDLGGFKLLHDERKDDWQAWLHLAGVAELDFISGPNFSDPALMLEAAVLGYGVALGSLPMAQDLIEQGKLVRPFEPALKTQEAFYLITHPRFADRPIVKKTRRWLIEAAARQKEGTA